MKLFAACTAQFAHGLVIASAPESTDTHDDWTPGSQAVHAGPDSLYILVRQAASGLATVQCVQGPYLPENKVLMYTGQLILPAASLVIADPNETVRLVIPVPNIENQVEIYGDGSREPDEVTIVLSGDESW